VRTRTLLILAVCCGFVILLAGGIQLLRIANQESSEDAEFSELGERVEVGDVTIVVEAFREADGVATVAVRIGGVDDEDGAAEFRLGVAGDVIAPDRSGERACGATTVAEQSCELTFGVADAAGGSRILVYKRGDEDARWELTA
jgi:hypothetical protein